MRSTVTRVRSRCGIHNRRGGRRVRTLAIALVGTALTISAAGPTFAVAGDPGGSFVDDDGNIHEGSIEAIAAVGITRGCNPPANDRYCPDGAVTRGQMAAFLTRALGLPPTGVDAFDDDDASPFEDDINRLAAAGITRGCDPPTNDRFCPGANVTRGQMAAFLVRAYGYVSGAGQDRFIDDDGSVFEADIDRLATAGVTRGCNPPSNDRYCAGNDVRRDEMATFLARAEMLTPDPPPARCPVLPADNIWNQRVDTLPVDPRSNQYIATIGSSTTLHPDFGSGEWPPGSGSPIGIPVAEVAGGQTPVTVTYTGYGDESDPGPFPIPADAPIEGGPTGTGDRHVIVVDLSACVLYELFNASPEADGSWRASSGARYDLTSNQLRPDGWTSGDAAGLPIYPGLLRYEEVAAGRITHAIRFTAPQTRNTHVWPARHHASSLSGPGYPPMGQRFRLKAGYDVSGYSPQIQAILGAFKEYGLILADNGSPWYVSGAPDPRWDNDILRELRNIPGSAFEAVDVSSLMVDPDSGQVRGG